MPCVTYDPLDNTPSPIPDLKSQIADLEAALCAALGSFEGALREFRKDYDECLIIDPLDWIDFEEAGVSERKLRSWWADHKKKDQARREREAVKRNKAALKASALAKLSSEERQALGIK